MLVPVQVPPGAQNTADLSRSAFLLGKTSSGLTWAKLFLSDFSIGGMGIYVFLQSFMTSIFYMVGRGGEITQF